uniref:Uncharacterized protein n=1 Tax=Rhizophora mucronata TaxID=61149 RepID=A0A2P2QWC7_RHIMU
MHFLGGKTNFKKRKSFLDTNFIDSSRYNKVLYYRQNIS